MRELAELIATEESAWPMVQEWVASAARPVHLLDVTGDDGAVSLVRLQVTLRSPMGAVAFYTGGLLIDGGWVRVFGAGSPKLPRSLPAWSEARLPITDALLVADDAIGGFFALNGGGLSGAPGKICYFAPDTLAWDYLDLSYSEFLCWVLSGDLDSFYEDFRWLEWRADVARLGGNQAFSFYPPLWAKVDPTSNRSRRAVPVDEVFAMQLALARQL